MVYFIYSMAFMQKARPIARSQYGWSPLHYIIIKYVTFQVMTLLMMICAAF